MDRNPFFGGRMLLCVPLALLLVGWLSLQDGHAAGTPEADCARGHILVRFKPEARAVLPAAGFSGQLTSLLARLDLPAGSDLQEPQLARVFRQKSGWGARPRPEQIDLNRFFYLRLPTGLEPAGCVRRLQNHPLLEYAEPDYIGKGAATIPTDPNFAEQWHHQNSSKPSASIQTTLAWDITQGSTNVLVAVLDTGLAELPEFAGRTVPGYNFAYADFDTTDDNGHGTAVAGIIGASANNASLVSGVDWRCRIMPVKVLDYDNVGYYSTWAQGIDYAVSNGCKVINLSAGGFSLGRTLERAITNAIAHGVIFVTVAGNEYGPTLTFPGYLNESITVGATDREDRRADYSSYGPELDLVAPGEDVPVVGLYGDLEFVGGTSFSAPLVAGVCALMAAVRPELTQAEARLLLCAGADDEVGDATDTPGFDGYHGWGRLNAFKSLQLATTRVDQTRRVDGAIELSWLSPADASSRQPYRIEHKTRLADAWVPLTNVSEFRYETNRTFWTDDGSLTSGFGAARFYRVGLRPF